MKQFTLTARAARMFVLQLESNPGGYKVPELRLLRLVRLKVSRKIADYDTQITSLNAAHQLRLEDAVLEAESVKERDRVVERLVVTLNRCVRQVDDTLGTVTASPCLEDTQFSFAKTVFSGLQFRGDKESTDLVLEIDEALEKAREVDVDVEIVPAVVPLEAILAAERREAERGPSMTTPWQMQLANGSSSKIAVPSMMSVLNQPRVWPIYSTMKSPGKWLSNQSLFSNG